MIQRPNSKDLPHDEVESPLHQFLPIASCPSAWHHQEPGFILLTPSLQSLLKAEQTQLCQPFLKKELLQPPNHLYYLLLDLLQELHISLVLWSTELDSKLKMWPFQAWEEGQDHLPQPGDVFPDATFMTKKAGISLLGRKDERVGVLQSGGEKVLG